MGVNEVTAVPAVNSFELIATVEVNGPLGVVILDVAEEAEPVPAAFVAVTWKVYAVLGESPETVMGDVEPVPVIPVEVPLTYAVTV